MMEDDHTPRALDALLENSVPPTFRRGPAVDASIAAVIGEARTASTGRRLHVRRPSRAVALILSVALLGAGGAATAAAIRGESVWELLLTPEATQRNTVMEWQVRDPSGERCVFHFNAFDLSQDDREAVFALLRDPQRLVAYDGGATRRQWLADPPSYAPGLDLDAAIDFAYQQVSRIDFDAGRGGLSDAELDSSSTSVQDEAFFLVYGEVVEGGLAAGLADRGIDPFTSWDPFWACEGAQ